MYNHSNNIYIYDMEKKIIVLGDIDDQIREIYGWINHIQSELFPEGYVFRGSNLFLKKDKPLKKL